MQTILLSFKKPFVLMALIVWNFLFPAIGFSQSAANNDMQRPAIITGCGTAAPTVVTPVTYCQDVTAVQLTATGTSLLWYPSATGGTGSASAPTPSTTVAGTTGYFVSSTDGCEGPRAQIDVVVNAAPDVNAPSGQVLCAGSTTTIINFSGAVSGTTFNWANDNTGIGLSATGNGNIPAFAATNNTGLNQVANISVTPVANGCTGSTKTFTITVNAPPTTTFISTNVSVCGGTNDGSITATSTGGSFPYTYSWAGSNGYTAGNVSAVTGLPIGYYTFNISDALGCSVSTANIHIGSAFSVYITNSGSNSSACANTGSIILYGNAGVLPYSYSLDGSNYQPGNTFPNLAAGNYTAYVKDAAGCVSSKSITVASASSVSVTAYSRPSSVCTNNGSIELYRTGGAPSYSYSIDNVTYQTSNTFLNLAAGNYVGYVKDSKNCIGMTAVTVLQGPDLFLSANKTNTSTCINNGTIQLNAGGGVAVYTYSLDNLTYQPGNSFTGLAAGNYTGYVKDSKACISQVSVTVGTNPVLVTAYAAAATNCASVNGSIQLFRTGGVGPYMYSLDNIAFQTSTTFTGLAAGMYNGYVRDSKMCVGSLMNITVGPNCLRTFAQINMQGNDPKTGVNDMLSIQAYPNPSNTEFTLLFTGNYNNKVSITVTDMFSRKVYATERTNITQLRFGRDFKPGIYLVEVIEGNSKQSIKVIKE